MVDMRTYVRKRLRPGREQLVAEGVATEEDIERHLANVAAGRLDLAQPPMIAAWGRRPF